MHRRHRKNPEVSLSGRSFAKNAERAFGNKHETYKGNTGVKVHSTNSYVEVCKSEYLMDVIGSSAISTTDYPINAGEPTLFPLGSSLAQNFEQWQLIKMTVYYRPMVERYLSGTNTTLGEVLIGCQYNANDTPYTTVNQFLQNQDSSSCSVDKAMSFDVITKDKSPRVQYIRTGNIAYGFAGDRNLYDYGILNIGIRNCQSTGFVGEIYVDYCYRLYKNNPAVFPNYYVIPYDHYVMTANTIAALTPFGTRAMSKYSNLGTNITNSTITFPSTITSGNFMIYWLVGLNQSNQSCQAPQSYSLTSCNATSYFLTNFTQPYAANLVGNNASYCWFTYFITITGPSATFIPSDDAVIPNPTFGDLIITQVSGYMNNEQYDKAGFIEITN